MKSLSYFDSSYSPNEASEQNDNYMDCGACYDTGMIVEEDVYCDCMHGNARIGHDVEDMAISATDEYTMADKLADNCSVYGEC
jgi:hypothetical protein